MPFDYTQISAAFPWFFPLAVGLFGACIGSFLNVVIYRVPLGKSIVFPGSHCGCGQPIAPYDNIPVLSWLILRGRFAQLASQLRCGSALCKYAARQCCVQLGSATRLCAALLRRAR